MRILVVAAAALLAYLIWDSLSWHVFGDASIYHYIAWLMTEGLVPYRDIFDFNMPGALLVHYAVLRIGGDGDVAWRVFDLAALAGISVLLYLFCRPPAGRWGAAAAAAIFPLFHLVGGSWMSGQRDYLLCGLFLAALLALARYGERGGGGRWLVAAGLALGVGVSIKPFVGLLWLACALAAATFAEGALARRARAGAMVLAAGLLPLALVFAWLATIGGLRHFFRILFDYTLPFYGSLGPGPLAIWTDIGPRVGGWPLLLFIVFLGLLGWSVPATPSGVRRRALTLLGVGYGLAHYALQGKGFPYHLYPLVCFLAALAAPALGGARAEPAREAGSGAWRAAVTTLPTRGAAIAVYAALLLALGVGGVSGCGAFDPNDEFGKRGDLLMEDLSRLVRPGELVQAMDDTWTESNFVLLRLKLRQPTPFVMDTPLFVDPEDPRIRRLRRRFVRDFLSARPAALVISQHNMVRRGFRRIEELPRLAAYLDENYTVAAYRSRAYVIWLRNDLARERLEAAAPEASAEEASG